MNNRKIQDRPSSIQAEVKFESNNYDKIISLLGDSFRNSYMTDVNFLVGDEIISCHKMILGIHSKVFDVMFNGSLSKEEKDPIQIPDLDTEVFKLLIEYMYTSRVKFPITLEMTANAIYAARKYDIFDLENILVDWLQKHHLELKSALSLIIIARLFDLKELENKAWNLVDTNAEDIIQSKEFLNIDKNMLDLLLLRDSLAIDETKLFNGVICWAMNECQKQSLGTCNKNLRKVLKDSLYLIRFPSMSSSSFANGPAKLGVLSDEEVANIFLYICSSDENKAKINFPFAKRNKSKSNKVVVECICRTKSFYCFYCNNFTVKSSSARESSDSSRLIGHFTPVNYCSCRTRGFCPKSTKIEFN